MTIAPRVISARALEARKFIFAPLIRDLLIRTEYMYTYICTFYVGILLYNFAAAGIIMPSLSLERTSERNEIKSWRERERAFIFASVMSLYNNRESSTKHLPIISDYIIYAYKVSDSPRSLTEKTRRYAIIQAH